MGVRRTGLARFGSVVFVATFVCGCAVRVPPSSVSLRPAIPAAPGPVPSAGPGATTGAGGPLTLADAIARATASHPLLSARHLEVRAREADARQAARPPNPLVTAEVEDIGGSPTSASPSQTTIGIAQRLELGDKRSLRTGLAVLERDNAEWELAIARSDIEGRVASAFVAVLVATSQLELARVNADTADEMAATVRARVNAGVAAPPEADRADAAAASARIATLRIAETRRAAVITLASTWGGAIPDDLQLSGALVATRVVPSLAALDTQLASSPAVARWVTELARRNQDAAVARASRVPDLDLGVGYRRLHDTDAHALVLGATVALPWLDRRNDAVTAAQLRADAGTAEASSALVTARELVATAHSSAVSAAAALAVLDEDVIPLSQRAYDATLEGYRAGRFPLVDVLDARRSLTAAQRDRIDALGHLHQQLVTLQRLVGATPVLAETEAQGGRQ